LSEEVKEENKDLVVVVGDKFMKSISLIKKLKIDEKEKRKILLKIRRELREQNEMGYSEGYIDGYEEAREEYE